jgi:hypothetical protein
MVSGFPVSGRRLAATGNLPLSSKSPFSNNRHYGVTFRWMVRLTFGQSAAIGLHSIPRYSSGIPMQTVTQLGRPVGKGGCPHSADANAQYPYR